MPFLAITPVSYACLTLRISVTVSARSEEHTSELQSLMRISYAVFWLKKKKTTQAKPNKRYYNYPHKNSHLHHYNINYHYITHHSQSSHHTVLMITVISS